jgi:hypothetical protein
MRKLGIAVLVTFGLVGLLILAALPIILPAIPFMTMTSPRPSDAEAIAHFRDKRALLEQLVVMAKEDPKLKRLDDTWSDPEGLAAIGISPERLLRYRTMLREAGVARGFRNNGDSITFIHHASGLGIRGSGKLFIWGTAPAYAETADGDLEAEAKGRRHIFLIRRIDAQWWLALDST